MNILIVNVGSSTVKWTLNKEKGTIKIKKSYQEAIKKLKTIVNKNKIDAIGYRVVHGGSIKEPCKITKRVEKIIEKYAEFAPLHNPPFLKVFRELKKIKVPHVAVFDTAFFANLPDVAKTYAIPKKYKYQRYGFHGINHKAMAEAVKKPRIITVHLGNGCSIAAIKKGKPIDTSMGTTPLEGLIMGTRSGDIDPGILLHLIKEKGWSAKKTETFLYNECGLKGLTGKSDIRDILKKGSKKAIDLFCYRVTKYIGSYLAILGKPNAIVFSGGIGQNNPSIRKKILAPLKQLKIKTKVIVFKAAEDEQIKKEVKRILPNR